MAPSTHRLVTPLLLAYNTECQRPSLIPPPVEQTSVLAACAHTFPLRKYTCCIAVVPGVVGYSEYTPQFWQDVFIQKDTM